MEVNQAVSVNIAPPSWPDAHAPAVLPKPAKDDLDGCLNVLLAGSVQPHRQALAAILRAIDGTASGRAILDFFRDLAVQDKPLAVNLLATGAALPDADAAQALWLHEVELSAGAAQIGVPPEIQYAPSVFQSLVTLRGAMMAQQSSEQAERDAAGLQARFQEELAASDSMPAVRRDGADGIDAMRDLQAVTKALDQLKMKGDVQPPPPVPADPVPAPAANGRKPSESSTTSSAGSISVTSFVAGGRAGPAQAEFAMGHTMVNGVANGAATPAPSRRGSQEGLAMGPGASTPSAHAVQEDAAAAASTLKQKTGKPKWQRRARVVARPFESMWAAFSQWRAARRQHLQPAAETPANPYRSDSAASSRKPSVTMSV